MNTQSDNPLALTLAWIALVALTFASLALGKWIAPGPWLPLSMALVIWAKCAIIADRFIEANQAHPFIRGVVLTFIAIAPIALILITFFGPAISHWTTL